MMRDPMDTTLVRAVVCIRALGSTIHSTTSRSRVKSYHRLRAPRTLDISLTPIVFRGMARVA